MKYVLRDVSCFTWMCEVVSLCFWIHECLSLHVHLIICVYVVCVKVGTKWINGWDTAAPTAQCLGLCLWLMCSCLGWQCQREWCAGMNATAACWFTGFHFHWCKVNLCGRSAAPACTLASFNPHPSGQASTTQEGAGIRRGDFLESGDMWIHPVPPWVIPLPSLHLQFQLLYKYKSSTRALVLIPVLHWNYQHICIIN